LATLFSYTPLFRSTWVLQDEPHQHRDHGPPPRHPSGSGLVAHLAAHLAQEPALGGGEAADAARRDLVEHAVDLGLRGIALGPTRLPRVAPPRRPRGVDEHAGRDRAP